MKSKLSIFALLALLLASCTQEMIIPEEPVNEMEKAGETVTINATIPQDQEEDTRVAYNDGTRKLSWEENDQLLLVGFNGTTYKGHSTFTWTGTDNKFTGTTVPGATTYKAYYPANAITVDGNGNVHLAADFLQQTQTGNNSTAHLSGKLFLSDTDANALTVPFSLKAQNSIIKFVLSNIPSDIGTLKKLIWAVETKTGGNTRSVLLDINGVSSGATSLTAFVAFDPTEMKIAANGKVKITLIGNKSYEWSKTVSAGKNYNKGNRYTATVNSGWTAALAQFRFTITTDQANQYYTIYQNDEKNSPANLTIIWGDGTANTTIASGAILTKEIASHKYATAGNYTITIFSDKADPSYKQIPQITFYNYSFGDTKLTAILDPFPNMGAQNFDEDFLACSRLASVPAELFKYNAGAISFVRCFENCPQLSSIPSELFRYNTQATDFFGCFMRCSGLASIPAELFRYNTQARCFRRCFDHCTELASIPAELFRYCTQATDFSYCFNECNQLTAIPAELFKYNTQATDFSFCFCNCHGLTGANAIPTDLFRYNKQAENFECCFCSCDGLSEIPTELFKYNKQATDFSFCFYGCTGLTAIPAGLFVNNIVA